MNLLNTTNQVVGLVSPTVPITWLQSTGYTTDAAGNRTPTSTSTTVQGQVQGITGSDLRHVDGLNIQGVMRSVHLFGNALGVSRADQQGGDILQFPEVPGGVMRNWRVFQVMETWPTWCRVLVVLQSS